MTDLDFGEGPGRWTAHGACLHSNVDFFPSRSNTKGIDAAKAICATCPVVAQCADYSVNEEYGVWGGKSEAERAHARFLSQELV